MMSEISNENHISLQIELAHITFGLWNKVNKMSQLMRLWYLSQATSKGSGEPAHPRSPTRAFAVRTHEVWK